MNLQMEADKRRDLVNTRLERLLEAKYPEIIYDAMSYSCMSGGKRMRPLLLLAVFEAVCPNPTDEEINTAIEFACALEMIHSYSLIHDDLPALDNDDYRRGKPTSHKVYGEAIAILAGDALLNYAYEVMANRYSTASSIEALKEIARAAGTQGMIGGQVVDILSEGKEIDLEGINYIHKNKTAAIIQAAAVSGGILGNSPHSALNLLHEAGEKLGIAFQIKDDILDIVSTQEVLGKPINSDAKNKKATYISVMGMDETKKEYQRLSDEALALFKQAAPDADRNAFLIEFIKNLTDRIN